MEIMLESAAHPKTAAFVDGSYLHACWSALMGRELEALALRGALEAVCGSKLDIAYYFDARFADGSGRESFRQDLLKVGFRVKAHYRIVRDYVRDEIGNLVRDLAGRPVNRLCQKGSTSAWRLPSTACDR